MLYGRGSQTGYVGALSAASVTLSAVSASVAPSSPAGAALAASPFVIVAPDAGDLLSTTGTAMHEGPATTAASVALTAGQVIQVNVVTDSPGALGYNLYVSSVSAGPFYYFGRTGYSTGYITSQPSSGPTTTSGAADQSAVANNYDGLLTNVAASGGYVKRLNAAFSTSNPGTEYQTAFATLYESVKADPEQIWLNGFDRMQLSNALLNNTSQNAYRVFIPDDSLNGVKVGAVVQSLLNQVTGSEVAVLAHPWLPQGNSLVRSVTLPIPDSNVAETSVMALPQDYVAVQWPAQQFTYDASTFQISTFCHYAPGWSALLQGIEGVGISTTPPGPYGDA